MTGKEKFIKALKREPVSGHVPHFELVFYLTMESIGKVHPLHRDFGQWSQMSNAEKKLHLNDIADCYIDIAKKYHHSAIFVHFGFPGLSDFDFVRSVLETIREKSGDEYFLLIHGDSTFSIPDGENMIKFSVRMYDKPHLLINESKKYTNKQLKFAKKLQGTGLLDGFGLCSDYCFNTAPFFSNEMFDKFIVPPLTELIAGYREMGYYSIKHTDGNIMPILDQIVGCKPDALHSLDPQGGVDLAEVKRLVGDKVALIGNVNCGLMQTGTDEEVVADVKRSLKEGMPGGGYIFSTSNCVYTGLPLERYELVHKVWRKYGEYK